MSAGILQWLPQLCFKYIAVWLSNLTLLSHASQKTSMQSLSTSGKTGDTDGKEENKGKRKKGKEMRSRRERADKDYI